VRIKKKIGEAIKGRSKDLKIKKKQLMNRKLQKSTIKRPPKKSAAKTPALWTEG